MLPGNANLWRLLIAAERQWRMKTVTEAVKDSRGYDHPMVTSRPVGLDMAALTAMAPAYGLEPDQSLFDKLHAFETACLGIWLGSGCTERQKKKCTFEFGEEHMAWTCANCEKNPESS